MCLLQMKIRNIGLIFWGSMIIFIIKTSEGSSSSYEYSWGHPHQFQRNENASENVYLPEKNFPVEIIQNRADNLTIFELITLNKLQRFGEDVMGVRKFQEPFWVSPSYLLNLLDSSEWNLKKAERKFEQAMKRRDDNINKILDEKMFDYFYYDMKGFDKEGCPVIIVPVGDWRTYRSYVEKVKSIHNADQNLNRYFKFVMNGVIQKLKSKSLSCSHITLILDMENYTFLHTSGLPFFLKSIKWFEKSYPSLLKVAFIINSSPEFLKTAHLYKSAVPWDLRRKSFIYTDKSYWKDTLLQNIDPSQIAPKYGGDNFFFE